MAKKVTIKTMSLDKSRAILENNKDLAELWKKFKKKQVIYNGIRGTVVGFDKTDLIIKASDGNSGCFPASSLNNHEYILVKYKSENAIYRYVCMPSVLKEIQNDK